MQLAKKHAFFSILLLGSLLFLFACSNKQTYKMVYNVPIYSNKPGKTYFGYNKKKIKPKPVIIEEPTLEPYDYLSHEDSFHFQKTYKIGVILPFAFDSLYRDSAAIAYSPIPRGIYPALDFYEGLRIALDSLHNTGMHLDIHIVDYTKGRKSFKSIANKAHLEEMDLLMGTLNSNDATEVAAYALEKRIPFLSPLANSFLPTHNPYYITINPSIVEIQQKTIHFFKTDGSEKATRFIIINSNKTEKRIFDKYFSAINKTTKLSAAYEELNWSNSTKPDTFFQLLDSNFRYIIILPSTDANYASQFLQAMKPINDSIKLCYLGLPSWKDIESINTLAGRKAEIYIPNTYSVDKNGTSYKKFSRRFYEKFRIAPSELAIRGYANTLLAAHALNSKGTGFYLFKDEIYKTMYLQPIRIVPSKNKTRYPHNTVVDYYYNPHLSLIKYNCTGKLRINVE